MVMPDATHKGELNGIAPTGKTIDITGISVVRLVGPEK